MLTFKTCPRCDGSGLDYSLIEERPYTCGACGGHKKIPSGAGVTYYYKPIEWKYGYLTQRVAVLTNHPTKPGKYTVTKYAPNGPMSDYTATAKEIMGEELRGFICTPFAERTLDAWGRTGVWKHGAKQFTWVALHNTIMRDQEAAKMFNGIYGRGLTFDEMIQEAWAIKHKYMPGLPLFG